MQSVETASILIDTTLRSPRTRRTVLVHALLAYLFGVVIIAGAINLSAGLLG